MKFEQKIESKTLRTFSETFKKEQVKLIEEGKTTVRQVSDAYHVSVNAVYKWVKKYSLTYPANVKQVIELESEAAKTLALQKQTKELERIIGQKQIQIEFLEKLIATASEDLGIDLKKVTAGKLSNL
jgi:transposase-like protein